MGRDTDSSGRPQQSNPNPLFASETFYDWIAPVENYLERATALIEGVQPIEERHRVIESMDLEAGDRILVVAIGTGRSVPLLARKIDPEGEIVGLDLSRAMLRQCRPKSQKVSLKSTLIEGTALRLPFRADQFDNILHFGGLTAFGDRERAIEEMTRVAKPGATIVISDKSLPSTRERSPVQRVQAWMKPQLTTPPPVELIPVPENRYELKWIWGGSMYLLKFSNPKGLQ